MFRLFCVGLLLVSVSRQTSKVCFGASAWPNFSRVFCIWQSVSGSRCETVSEQLWTAHFQKALLSHCLGIVHLVWETQVSPLCLSNEEEATCQTSTYARRFPLRVFLEALCAFRVFLLLRFPPLYFARIALSISSYCPANS